MRVAILTILAGAVLFLLPSICFADSPITSTSFSDAYLDYDIVQMAKNEGVMNLELAEYLATPSNPIDIKAAIINALSWDIDGKNNADLFVCYLALKYGISPEKLDTDLLDADERFCLGYLRVMDNYFQPENGIPLLEEAQRMNGDSFTVAIVTALAKAQAMFDGDWVEMWHLIDAVYSDQTLTQDMRADASAIIYDYMSLYEKY